MRSSWYTSVVRRMRKAADASVCVRCWTKRASNTGRHFDGSTSAQNFWISNAASARDATAVVGSIRRADHVEAGRLLTAAAPDVIDGVVPGDDDQPRGEIAALKRLPEIARWSSP